MKSFPGEGASEERHERNLIIPHVAVNYGISLRCEVRLDSMNHGKCCAEVARALTFPFSRVILNPWDISRVVASNNEGRKVSHRINISVRIKSQ